MRGVGELDEGVRLAPRSALRPKHGRAAPYSLPSLRRRLERWDVRLFLLGTFGYLLTRFIGLTRFPIYFFSDEAIQTNLADGLLRNGLRSDDGVLLPPYFFNAERYSLSLSVYLQLPAALFGPSVVLTRGTSVMVGLLAVAGVAVIARVGFSLRVWWIAPVVLGAIPAWFLHSRTAFEVSTAVAFYAGFLGAYVLYRMRSPRWAPVAVLLGGGTFYSYTNAQGLMLVTGVLLLASDFGYHRRELPRRRVARPTAIAFALVALPYIRERFLHPASTSESLKMLGSYWYDDLSLPHKLETFVRGYAEGLDPRYWFSPDGNHDISRHVMAGMGHVWWPLAVFALVGLVICVRNRGSSPHRLVLIAVLASPFTAAIVDVQINRTLMMIVPIAVLTCLGIERAVAVLRRPDWRDAGLGVITVGLAWLGIFTLQQALAVGPFWDRDYGLYGLQWGSSQVFAEIDRRLEADPQLQIRLSSNWANNPDALVSYFLDADEEPRVIFDSAAAYVNQRATFDPSTLFVFSANDYGTAVASGVLDLGTPELVIPWPDGRPGFYFTHLRYTDDADERFAVMVEARHALQQGDVAVDGTDAIVRYNALDIGEPAALFDGDTSTLIRGSAANPFVLELEFPGSRRLAGIELTTATMDFELVIEVLDAAGDVVVDSSSSYTEQRGDPVAVVDFEAPVEAHRLRLTVTKLHAGEPDHVHLRELVLR